VPAGKSIALDDIEILAGVYGPGSTPADFARMQGLGEGWVRGITQWQLSGATYLLLVSRNFDGASHAEPTVVLAQDREQAEHAIWEAMLLADSRLCLLESFEPALASFVAAVIEGSRRVPGHA
jgi:hypothetical protein